MYAILRGLKAIAFSNTLNGIGFIVGCLANPVLGDFMYCGNGKVLPRCENHLLGYPR